MTTDTNPSAFQHTEYEGAIFEVKVLNPNPTVNLVVRLVINYSGFAPGIYHSRSGNWYSGLPPVSSFSEASVNKNVVQISTPLSIDAVPDVTQNLYEQET
jgi:hypothetical protein